MDEPRILRTETAMDDATSFSATLRVTESCIQRIAPTMDDVTGSRVTLNYKLVLGEDPESFTCEVQALLDRGWSLCGGVSIRPCGSAEDFEPKYWGYAQALTKRADIPQEPFDG